jgi:gamma-glutamyl hydrolase
MTMDSINYYHHKWAVSPELYTANTRLKDFFDVTAYNQDSEGTPFVASVEARRYPFYGIQYHPEKSAYEWEVDSDHSDEAIAVASIHSTQFVRMVTIHLYVGSPQHAPFSRLGF